MARRPRRSWPWMVAVLVTVALAGFVGVSSGIAAPPGDFIDNPQAGAGVESDNPTAGFPPATDSPSRSLTGGVADRKPAAEALQLADSHQGPGSKQELQILLRKQEGEIEEYDPWEPYNEPMFSFNREVFDRYLLKPVATAWDTVVPDPVQRSLSNVFDNLGMPRRVVNNLLQLKFKRAGLELTRFILNTTIGIAGIFDIAKEGGIERSDEDTGQTLGVYGVGPGPYLILPVLSPLTVRDGVGLVVDMALDPLNYVLPFAATAGRTAGSTVNDRSINLELYESVEDVAVDLYSAVRNAYLQRRQKAIEE